MKLIILQAVLVSLFTLVCISNTAAVERIETVNNTQLPSVCSFSGTFIQSQTQNNSESPSTSSGTVFYDCKHGIIWRTEEETISTKIITIDNLHFLPDENDNITRLDSIPDSLQAKLLLSVLAGDEEFIDKHFNIEANDHSTLAMIPKTNTYKRGLQSMTLNSDQEGSHVVIKIVDRKERVTVMTITQDHIYVNDQLNVKVCESLYADAEYCNILNNPIDYQSIDR